MSRHTCYSSGTYNWNIPISSPYKPFLPFWLTCSDFQPAGNVSDIFVTIFVWPCLKIDFFSSKYQNKGQNWGGVLALQDDYLTWSVAWKTPNVFKQRLSCARAGTSDGKVWDVKRCQQRAQASFLSTDMLDLTQDTNIAKFFATSCSGLNNWPKITRLSASARNPQTDNARTRERTHNLFCQSENCVSVPIMCSIPDPRGGGSSFTQLGCGCRQHTCRKRPGERGRAGTCRWNTWKLPCCRAGRSPAHPPALWKVGRAYIPFCFAVFLLFFSTKKCSNLSL